MGLEHGAGDAPRMEAAEGVLHGGLGLREHDVAVLGIVHVAPLHPDGQCGDAGMAAGVATSRVLTKATPASSNWATIRSR